jgi:hypothetical protein
MLTDAAPFQVMKKNQHFGVKSYKRTDPAPPRSSRLPRFVTIVSLALVLGFIALLSLRL